MNNNQFDFLLQQIEKGTASEEQMAQADALLTQMEKRMERQIDGWNTVERTTHRRARTISLKWIAGIAASLLLLVSVALVVNYRYERQHYAQQQPKDTFDNPEDAAAETQRALLKFSETINKAIQ
jgi:hypothetical protein